MCAEAVKVNCLSGSALHRCCIFFALAVATACHAVTATGDTSRFFVIHVIDESTGRGVPLTELCTTSKVCYWTDSNGIAVIDEPNFNGMQVFFSVSSDGYEYPQKVSGYSGTILTVEPGTKATLKLNRVELAERLYRVTGEGIYHDSALAGLPFPPGGDQLRAQATGMDSVMFTIYHNHLFWLFGDTTRLSAPLGNFASTCALSDLGPAQLSPEDALELKFYMLHDGFVKPMVDIPGPGPKWLSALMVVNDSSGHETMYARYKRVNGMVSVYDSGIAVFDDRTSTFKAIKSTGAYPKFFASGRATPVMIGNQKYFYFSGLETATPSVRVRALTEDIVDPAKYERYACDQYSCEWRPETVPTTVHFFDIDTGVSIDAKVLSLAWNRFRQRWIAIIWRPLGEVWYAEADTPAGPWSYARRIITHTQATFYWPGQIWPLDTEGGRRIYIMGTYTHTFNKNPEKTPRYEYNQLLYGLSLDSPDLAMPTARYQVNGHVGLFTAEQISTNHLWSQVDHVVDFIDSRGRTMQNHNSPFMFDRNAGPVR